jgi:hypothetical protein
MLFRQRGVTGARPAWIIISPVRDPHAAAPGCATRSAIIAIIGQHHALQVGVDLLVRFADGEQRQVGCRARPLLARSECTRRSVLVIDTTVDQVAAEPQLVAGGKQPLQQALSRA